MSIATCYPCAKYLLLVLNLFFWLSGAALIVLGVLAFLRPEVQHVIHLFNFTSLPFSSIELSALVLIIIGSIIFLIGLFGLCGAKRESRTCLVLYIVLVTCVLLAELALFTYLAISHEQWRVTIKQRLVSQMKNYDRQQSGQYERAVDYIQNKYQCCGMDSAYDYNYPFVPNSCCAKSNSASCSIEQLSANGTPGCLNLLIQQTIFWGKYFVLFELALCLLGLIGILLAICVCQNSMLYEGYTQAPHRA